MDRLRRNVEWSVVLFVVALLAFNPPVLSIFSVPDLIFGIPTLYLYIFVAWIGVIVLLAANVPGLIEADKAPPPAALQGPAAEAMPSAPSGGHSEAAGGAGNRAAGDNREAG